MTGGDEAVSNIGVQIMHVCNYVPRNMLPPFQLLLVHSACVGDIRELH